MLSRAPLSAGASATRAAHRSAYLLRVLTCFSGVFFRDFPLLDLACCLVPTSCDFPLTLYLSLLAGEAVRQSFSSSFWRICLFLIVFLLLSFMEGVKLIVIEASASI